MKVATAAAGKDQGDGGPGLRRVLGLPTLTFYGVGLILGAGIYSIIGEAAGHAGHSLWLAFLTGSVIALLTGLSYAELSAMYPKAGAEYHYARAAFGRPREVAAGTGLVLAAAGAATAATVAVAFGGYLRVLWDVPTWAGAVGLLLAATAVNLAGIRESTWANVVMTLVEVGGLALVIAVGASHVEPAKLAQLPEFGGVAMAAALVFFAFLGFEDIANLTEEARRPKRDAPRAIFIAVAVATVLYVLVAMAATALVEPDELAGSDSPLSTAVEGVHPRLATALAGAALAATANTALVTLLAASRMLFGLARGGDAPKPLGRVLGRRQTPWVASAAILAGCLLLLPMGGTGVLGGTASLLALTGFLVVNVSLVRLRWTKPDVERPFRVPWSVGRVPVLPMVAIVGTVGFATRFEPTVYALGGAAVAVVTAVLVWVRLRRRG